MDIRAYNRRAWYREVERGNQWTLPVSPAVIAAARQGQWEIVLTPIKPVPRAWFVLTGFYEDYAPGDTLSRYMPTFIATRATNL